MAVLSIIDALGRCAKDVHAALIKANGKVVRNLTAHRNDGAVWLFHFNNVHYTFKGEFIEVEAVAHVVVGRHGFGVIVNHHRTPAFVLDGKKRVYATPVELNRAADAIGTRTKHHNRTAVMLIINIVFATVISKVEIVGLCRIFGGKGVNLLHHRQYAVALAQGTNFEVGSFSRGIDSTFEHSTGNLEVRKTLLLCLTQQLSGNIGNGSVFCQLFVGVDEVAQFVEEPLVDFGELVNLLYGVALAECRFYDKDTLVGWLLECALYIIDHSLAVFNEAVLALTNHAKPFLNNLLKGATNGHYLAHRLHR